MAAEFCFVAVSAAEIDGFGFHVARGNGWGGADVYFSVAFLHAASGVSEQEVFAAGFVVFAVGKLAYVGVG